MAGETILVVDDNEMNRDMLSRRLQRQGYTTDVAENGERALEMIQQSRYDLVLLDVMMPKINGYEVLEQVKQDEALRHIPIIMISAVDDLDSVVKCIELGAEDYLFKPFNPVLLKARVGATIDKHRAQQSSGAAFKPTLTSTLQEIEALTAGQDGVLSPEQEARLTRVAADLRNILSSL
jgi:DNA-binding response OmpR family regulator